ncbi:unnamed protein product [Coffea canephora]|uniref:non-specific serine/threonine protein kinase n=1 Tax=Coffea canephora TaxID=49390 RepID=A0A068VKP9_COFCA|nr:unnamed protein product [Coffea canephora]
MENGNLDSWLHPAETTHLATSSRSLNLSQKLNIAIDVASALQYLHNHCEAEIVHCDLKPSNILLDNDLVAHVGDFGLARLLPKPVYRSSEQEGSSTVAIKGTIGYAAPEYGMGLAASTLGDVYSYGILLLEMITRRRPTDDMFMDELDLHNYVNRALPEQVCEIVEPLILCKAGDGNRRMTPKRENINGGREMECVISLLKLGLKCSQRLPNNRMHMNEVVSKLHLIKDPIPTKTMWGLRSSTLANIFLLLSVAMNFSVSHVSAAKQFQNETDRLALLEFKNQIHDDPFGVLNSWNHSQHHCRWEGVACSTRHQRMGLLKRLVQLFLAANKLSGIIPASIFNSSAITVISVADNYFHSNLPISMGLTLPNLKRLAVGINEFYGNFPTSITNASGLEELDLSQNKVAGQVPANLGDLTNLQRLNLERNLFGGNSTGDLDFIASLTNCSDLSVFSLSTNNFRGNIPKVVANLSNQLTTLYLGGNQLSGTIPQGFGNFLQLLSYLNLSYNNIRGEIPNTGVFRNESQISLTGNNKLCGGIPELEFPPCPVIKGKTRGKLKVIILLSIVLPAALLFLALIYELMENGNLDLWLHPSETTDQATSSRSLNVLQKLNIAIDVASALQYLHNHCKAEIVHCDLKPSNILLDNDLVAHVGDFGLARLLPKPINTSSEQRTSSTIAIKGSIGYAAPGNYNLQPFYGQDVT